jgi:uncharacterized protein YybS (DUF2232 family)
MKNKYLHAVGISIIGTLILMMSVPHPVILYRFIGGTLIGLGLHIARIAGREDK